MTACAQTLRTALAVRLPVKVNGADGPLSPRVIFTEPQVAAGPGEMAREHRGKSIDTMPLTMFYTGGICLDVSHKGLRELIETEDLVQALATAKLQTQVGDTVLLYTDHYRRTYGTDDCYKAPGLSVEATRWLGKQKIAVWC